MEQLELQLKTLRQKINLLVRQNQLLKKQTELLKDGIMEKEGIINEKDELLKKMEQHIQALNLATASLDKSDKKSLEKRIDTYLRDIEKCLAQLNA